MNPFSVFKKTGLAAAAVGMIGSSVFAEEAGQDLDLSALLNMEVTVASKKAEKISDAPGMIVAYSENDMKNLGYYTIRDLANLTTGYSSYRSIGEINLETRGQKASGFENNKHLLMVDGIPVRHARGGAVPVEEEMSLYGAKRVEFLKGPGSALYGTGAFFGVVNVVNKTTQEEGVEAKGKVTFGSDELSKRAMGHMSARNEEGVFNIDVSHFQKETDGLPTQFRGTRTYTSTETGATDVVDVEKDAYRNWDDKNATFFNMNYKKTSGPLSGVTGGYLYSRKSGGLGEFWWMNSSPLNNMTWEIMIPYVKYEKEFSDKFSFNSYVLGNQSVEHAVTDAEYASVVEEYMVKVADFETLLEGHYTISEDAGDVIFGANYDVRKSLGHDQSFGSYKFIADGEQTEIVFPSAWESDPFHTISFYGQYQNSFDVLAGLNLTAGFREDIGYTEENTFSQFSPRAGVVQKFTDKLNMKLLYGTALRAPGIKSAGVNAEVIGELEAAGQKDSVSQVPELGAEVIRSWESSVNFSNKKVSANVAGFYNQTIDEITKFNWGDRQIYDNSDDTISAYGVEADVKGAPIKDLVLMAGGSFAYAEKASDETQFEGVPQSKFNGAVSYTNRALVPMTLTPSFYYIPKYRNGGDADDDANYIEENNGNFYSLDMNFRVDFNENFGMEAMVKNLTDNTYYQPGIWLYSDAGTTQHNFGSGQEDATYADGGYIDPQNPGRSVSVSFNAKF
ncbi:MAG: TonB-dependent receptor plug domain-containing protein [Fibrobacterota bacterium]